LPPTPPHLPYTTLFRSDTVMPGIFYRPVNRRRFLLTTARTLAGAALIRELDLAGDDPSPDEKPVRFALLSDTHIPADAENQYRRSEEHTSELQSLRHLV